MTITQTPSTAEQVAVGQKLAFAPAAAVVEEIAYEVVAQLPDRVELARLGSHKRRKCFTRPQTPCYPVQD